MAQTPLNDKDVVPAASFGVLLAKDDKRLSNLANLSGLLLMTNILHHP